MPQGHVKIDTVDEEALRAIVTLLGGRGVRVNTLAVTRARNVEPSGFHIHLAADSATEHDTEMLVKRLNRLINVTKTVVVDEETFLQRRAVLIRVEATRDDRGHVLEVASAFDAEIVELSRTFVTLGIFVTPRRTDEFLSLLEGHHITEVSDSGTLAVRRSRLPAPRPGPGPSHQRATQRHAYLAAAR